MTKGVPEMAGMSYQCADPGHSPGWVQMHPGHLKLGLTILVCRLGNVVLSPGCDGAHSDHPQLGQGVAGCLRQAMFLELTKLGCCANCVMPAGSSGILMVCEDSLVYEYLCRLKLALLRDVGIE